MHRDKIRYLAIGMALMMSLGACKPKETAPDPSATGENTGAASDSQTAAVETTKKPDAHPDQMESADHLMEAYIKSFESGDWDLAQKFIWPYAEAFKGTTGNTISSIRESYKALGYGELSGGEFTVSSQYDDYTVYSVKYKFTPESDQELVQDEQITVVKVDDVYYISPDNLLCAYEFDAELLEASINAAAAAEEGSSADETETLTAEIENEDGSDSDDDESSSDSDSDSILEDEPLDGTEGSEVADAHAISIDEDELDESEGVTARVIRAASYSNGSFFEVEIDNKSEDTFKLIGDGEESAASAVVEGMAITESSDASVDLAKDLGFNVGNEKEGAVDSRYDTLVATFEVPEKQKANCELFFTQDLRMVYSLYFSQISLDENVRSMTIEFGGLKAIEGGVLSAAYLETKV